MVTQDNRLIPAPLDRAIDRPLTDLTGGKPYGAAATSPTNIRDYLFVILKRKWLILSLVLVVTSLVTIQMFRTPTIYQGAATIRIEPKPRSVLQTKEIIINSATDPTFWGTQLKLLQNPSLARQVVLTLDLQNNPNFMGSQAQGGFFAALKKIVNREPRSRTASPAIPTGANIVGENSLMDRPLTREELSRLEPYEDAILSSELVEPIEKTNLITIRYTHTDPELAQKISNTIAEVFIMNNLDRATVGSKKAEDVLAREIGKLQMTIKADQEKQFNYARAHNVPLTSDPGTNVELRRLNELSTQMLEAENDRKSAHSRPESGNWNGPPRKC
jgi:polysaccharide biosynthesis transport protein